MGTAPIDYAILEQTRTYRDPSDCFPHISMEGVDAVPWSRAPTKFTITKWGKLEKVVYHPFLCFLKLIKEYRFHSILDIGCGEGNEAELLRHLGKQVFTINADPLPDYKADFFGDYLQWTASKKYDAV